VTNTCENWGTLTDYGPVANPSVLSEYGKIALLHEGAGVTSPPLNWGSTTFSGKAAGWGGAFDWPRGLTSGYEFVFVFNFSLLPDLILADENILWTRARDSAGNGRVVMRYVPARDGTVRLSFLKDRRFRDPSRPEQGIQFRSGTGCVRMGQATVRAYPRYDRLGSLKTTNVEPLLTNRDFFQAPLVEPTMSPIERPGYPTMDVRFMHETLEAYVPESPSRLEEATAGQTKQIIDTLPILQANGFSGMMIYHLPEELLEALAKSTLRHFIVEMCGAGEWWLCREGVFINRSRYELGLSNCNRLLSRMPDCRVYFWFAEVEDREHFLFEGPLSPKKKATDVQDDAGAFAYNDMTDNEFWREESLARANREWKEEIWKKLSDPGRVTAVYQAGSPLAIMRFKNAGSDMTVNKAIFRGAFNITVAAGRGNARGHHQALGLDYDPWTWELRMTHHPDEWRQGWLVYLHAGVSFFYHEGTLFRRDADGRVKPTETGSRVCEITRYARRHPVVGEQIVKMAAMKGSGECSPHDVPKFMPQLPCYGDPPDWISTRFRDYSLLDVFFPKFGDFQRGNLHRFMTGTPYGPLDLIPWDTSVEDMRGYDFVFVLGSNGCDERQLETFTRYVREGGKLMLALGQLRGKSIEPRRVIQSDLTELAGATVDVETNQVTVKSAKIVHTYPDGSMILHHQVGRGEVYLFTTNTLTSLDVEQPRKILEEFGRQSAFVHFDPVSDWLEVMANRKGETISLCVFNHGRVGFPSGNGPKVSPWQGRVALDLAKLNLSGDVVVRQVEDGCRLGELSSAVREGQICFEPTVDFFAEFVIGPKDRIERDWFGSP